MKARLYPLEAVLLFWSNQMNWVNRSYWLCQELCEAPARQPILKIWNAQECSRYWSLNNCRMKWYLSLRFPRIFFSLWPMIIMSLKRNTTYSDFFSSTRVPSLMNILWGCFTFCQVKSKATWPVLQIFHKGVSRFQIILLDFLQHLFFDSGGLQLLSLSPLLQLMIHNLCDPSMCIWLNPVHTS